MSLRTICTAIALGLTLCCASARAALVAEDLFNYPEGTLLGGQTGGTGWTSAWQSLTHNGSSFVTSPAGDWVVNSQEAHSVPEGLGNEVTSVHRRSYAYAGAVTALYFPRRPLLTPATAVRDNFLLFQWNRLRVLPLEEDMIALMEAVRTTRSMRDAYGGREREMEGGGREGGGIGSGF